MFNKMFCHTTYIYGLYDRYVQQHKYVYQQHIYVMEFCKILYTVSLNNIYVILR